MLAIYSKNNDEDVARSSAAERDAAQARGLLGVRINWQTKHQSLVAIAEALNIGVDSLVFVDDNPAECSLIEEMLPGVGSSAAADPAEYGEVLLELMEFEKPASSPRTVRSAAVPGEAAARGASRGGGRSRGYLASLQTEIRIRAPAAATLARVHRCSPRPTSSI